MTEESRLSDSSETAPVGRLLSSGVEGLDRPWSANAQAKVGIELEARLARRPSPLRTLAFALTAVVALIAGALWIFASVGREGAHRIIALGAEATLDVTAEGEIDLPPSTGERRVVLKAGEVCAEVAHRDVPSEGPLVVEAPRLKVVVVGTHFCVSTESGVSTVSVTRGRIRAESPSGSSVFVDAGESIRSDDPRLALTVRKVELPALVPSQVRAPTAPATSRCADAASIPERRSCYARAAKGTDIAAQNALYGLGFLERDDAHDGPAAIVAWQTYTARFPKGIFAPETALASMSELVNESRYAEALREADRYLATGDESARGRVALIRAQLLVGPLSQPAQALAPLLELVATGEASQREESLYTLGRCQLALGRSPEAQETFRRLLSEYPASSHAAEVRAWVP